ncbi:hypothetical protein AJ80_07112 [Polytolypa hystricis UAMH7299]|uniref:Uncharacterized protein n=1 Tax=Polytolypa hystricis (strain UAMH7299) TaxID=1447883 RepID=A0A2B7XRP5_POLH7|nr:hypothetical protein AJ80_07112 [Polytolypa hystricis UAMH7299]
MQMSSRDFQLKESQSTAGHDIPRWSTLQCPAATPPRKAASAPSKLAAPAARNMLCTAAAKERRLKMTPRELGALAGAVVLVNVTASAQLQRTIPCMRRSVHVGEELLTLAPAKRRLMQAFSLER